jgi:hypothetical protein
VQGFLKAACFVPIGVPGQRQCLHRGVRVRPYQPPRYGVAGNHVKLRIFEDGAVKITARYLDPKGFKIVMDETFFGRIDGGPHVEAVSFFGTD